MDKALMLNDIKEYLSIKNDAEFAEYLDITPQVYANWKKRNTFDAELLYTKCEFLNPSWILSGKGSMLNTFDNRSSSNMIEEPQHELKILKNNRKTKDGIVPNQEVPLYDLEATAGLQQLFDSGSPRAVLDTIKIPNLPKCDGAISITGDSMYPLLKSGDIVLYKQTNVDNIFFGEMYLLSVAMDEWEEYVMVKYVQKSEKGDEYVKLVSQNSHHQSKDIHISKITALALVKASIRINNMF